MQSYPFISVKDAIVRINTWSIQKRAFFFAFDYNLHHAIALLVDEIQPENILYKIGKYTNDTTQKIALPANLLWQPQPLSFADYSKKCTYVKEQIQVGNSFLVNLTQPTPIDTNLSLKDLYQVTDAKYKLWIRNQFVVLSPEPFIRIQGTQISSFPMKGTIDASIPDAEKIILSNPKEEAEHATIVDLIRNDLSMIASDVHIKRYRYIERINSIQKNLLQVSSEICGELPNNYRENLGTLITTLLPAGSISGAPKTKTLDIIQSAEGYERNFYTGICGYFDGENLDSAVMIRFIEQQGNQLVYKSGGGITANSDIETEYTELIQKIYVPIH
jgi:para-aminobenzoate synthetase component I